MQYVSYPDSKSVANIVVDGRGNEGSVLVLSHWRRSGTPELLRRDTSAQIVFEYLLQPEYHVEAEAVTNDHFDADGLVGLYSMLEVDEALAQREFLEDVADAGDFGKYKNRDAARVSFVIDAWLHPVQSPLNQTVFNESYPQFTNILYEELLPRFSKIVEKIDYFEKFWQAQDELLDDSEDAFARGKVKLEEYPHLDLAVVTMPDSNLSPSQSLSKLAIHNRTDCLRILLLQEHRYEFYFRYESWVDFWSRKVMPRIDMADLAQSLTKQESMDGVWTSEDVESLSPTMKLEGAPLSLVPADSFKAQLMEYLTQRGEAQ